MINFDNNTFFYDPFPYGLFDNFLDSEIYNNICSEFPKHDQLIKVPEKDIKDSKFNKFNLDNINHKKKFIRFINSTVSLKEFYTYLNCFLAYIFLVTLQPPEQNSEALINLVLGYLGGLASAVISFYFGASQKQD